eukprot:147845-Alexandrium_andersonii.AAC.1
MTSDRRVGGKMDGRGRRCGCVREGSVWSIQRPPGVALCVGTSESQEAEMERAAFRSRPCSREGLRGRSWG